MADLAAELPRLLPMAISWAEARAAEARLAGTPLDAKGVRLARAVGVCHPERVRVAEVAALPVPSEAELRSAALRAGLLGAGSIGLTLGYAIYVVKGQLSNRLLSHECRHVYQYEMAGSIAAFLPVYLQQVVAYGYQMAPYEVDARAHEF
jgi:hypothetical protein